MHDNRSQLEKRIVRELNERIRPAQTRLRIELPVTAWDVPGEPVRFREAISSDGYESISAGTPWGPPWGTTWFRIRGEVPPELPEGRAEVLVELGYGSMPGFSAEGTVWVDGAVVAGLHPRHRTIPLDAVVRDGLIELDVEASANPDLSTSFRPTPLGLRETAGDGPMYVFGGAFLVVTDDEVRGLVGDIRALEGLMGTLPVDHPRRKRLQYLFQRCFDRLDLDRVGATAAAARAELAPGLALAAAPGAHRISAVGHAHLDTAWLWPLRETRRKAARTFANAVELMARRPDYRFACSQAVQYSWIEQDHPELFERIRTAVAEGGWVPVGGMWVEADMNLPSGESIVRQLVHGQRYFESRFGVRCEEVWIPDVFGYPGSLPQIFTGAGCRRFVTQKLSWNKQNRMPHHSFWWEGIDGSRVLAHFPPVDTYNAEIRPNELAHAVANFADHYWSDHSLMPFGYGNGGGGPSEEMMERIDRLGDLEGMPRVAVESPSEFFEHLEAEAATAPVPVWRGELYFETHRGTLTSQVRTKVMNRRCETALRAAELWLATAGDDSHSEVLDGLWKKLLVHQFHDILPGSSIGWVHDDAEADLKAVLNAADGLIASTLCGLGEGLLVGNAATHDRDEVIAVDYDLLDEFGGPGDPSAGDDRQMLSSSEVAMRVRVPGLGVAPLDALQRPEPVRASLGSLSNGLVELSFDHYGELVSLRDCVRGRELIPPGCVGARFLLAPDHPVEFDAWDLEQWTGRLAEPLGLPDTIGLVDSGPLVGAVRTTWQFGRGTILTKDFVLHAGSPRIDVRVAVEWQEDERLLLLELPLDLHTDSAACEIQFGLQNRPTHTNTSWDDAKFEVCAHRFVDLCEGDFGVAVLNDGRYGHSLQPGPDTPPGTSRVRVSLLRAPRFPDPKADHGLHHVTISVLPHGPGRSEVLAEADSLNTPLVVVPAEGGAPTPPLVRVEDHQVQVSAVKLADDGSGELILRLWEATGNHVEAGIHIEGARREAVRCNLLEEQVPGAEAMELQDGRVSLSLTPFELVTLRIR